MIKFHNWLIREDSIDAISDTSPISSHPEDGYVFSLIVRGNIIKSSRYESDNEALKARDEVFRKAFPVTR